jgi:DNA mismatch repair protein MutS
MCIVTDYFEITKRYKDEYGKKTILLLQVGSFFEIYSFVNPFTNEISEISDIIKVSEICNLNIARKSNYIGDDNSRMTKVIDAFPMNPDKIDEWVKNLPKSEIVMAGFRDYSLDKYLTILTDVGYTVVVFTQIKDGKTIKRKLDHVYSPGTYISENSSNVLSNNVLSIWIETRRSTKTADKLLIGCSNVNIFTGKSAIFEYETEFIINPSSFDELDKFISEFNPNELILVYDFKDDEVIDAILQYLHTSYNSRIPIHRTNISSKNENNVKAINCTKQIYISQIITTFFEGTDCSDFMLNQIATQSFCYLLNFLQEHNPDLVRKINVPVFTNKSTKLLLANHTLRQLNIIDDSNGVSSGHVSSVLSLLNKACTAMGKRQFKNQLLNPTFDTDWLKKEYSIIDHILEKKDLNFIPTVRKSLQPARDIEKIIRQLLSNKLVPNTLFYLCKTVEIVKNVSLYLKDDITLCEYLNEDISLPTHIEALNFLSFVKSMVDIDACQGLSSLTFDKNIIVPSVSLELDILTKEQNTINSDIESIKCHLNQLIKNVEVKTSIKEQEFIKIHETDKSGITLQLTKKRGTQLRKILSNLVSNNCTSININTHIKLNISEITITSAGANDEINCVLLNGLCRKVLKNQENICIIINDLYANFLSVIENNWYVKLESIANFLSNLDVIVCKCYTAREYKYCKPQIADESLKSNLDTNESETKENAFVNCYGLRHVLVEHINTKEIFVSNDVMLNSSQQGFLLYGTNSAGKTTLIRALGISVILAQSGNYVPCQKFIYKPYTAIFSRIQNNDNLFMGLSSFALEMSEIRTIIKNADNNSLVLGDELCSSTDSISSISIFMATLHELYAKRSSFIFATHLHEISKYDELKEMTFLKFKHLSVKYNPELDKLIYERKIQEGSGNGNYGIEVAKSLHLPPSFIERSYSIRNHHFPQYVGDLNLKTSAYNSKKLKIKCEICGEPSHHIHHINEQNKADGFGFIGSMHKNNVCNLMSLCVKCHNNEHKKS